MHRSAHFLSAILAFGVAAAPLQAQTPVETTVYAVAYVDVMPSGRSSAIAALKAYQGASAGDAGHVRIDVLEQIGRPGHFAVVEAWRDQGAFDDHAGSAAMKQLQQAMDSVRVSGYDQRPYKPLSVGAARPGAGSAVYIVSHVDIAGAAGQAIAPAMLRQLAEASRKEQGNLQFDVLQHTTRLNHYTVFESWPNEAALDAHVAAMHTRQYRDTVQPISGSPVDERIYRAVN